jgi:Ca2+-transporting ATPase
MFIAVQVFYLLNCRSLTQSMFSLGPLSNLWVVGGIGIMAVLQVAFTYAPPMHALFHTASIGFAPWALIFATGAAMYVIVEGEKRMRNALGRPVTHAFHGLQGEDTGR